MTPSREHIADVIRRHHGRIKNAAEELGMPRETLRNWVRGDAELLAVLEQARGPLGPAPVPAEPTDETFLARLHALIARKGTSVEELADALDVAPRTIRVGLDALREQGYRIPSEGTISLARLAPDQHNLHKTLDRSLLDGDVIQVGVVSDTHLGSNEEALPELHLAYDHFKERGISEVWHAGDLVCGRGIFRGQDSEIKVHTYGAQIEYAIENYPKRDGIVTRLIAGNHDVEGDFGKIGADPVVAVTTRREDMEYLGTYGAWIELPNGAWVHLLHGKGGMSYSYSYKAQKLVDGYPGGRKPAALIVGHWHVSGHIEARGVQVIWPGCFEWQSKFLERLGLHPSVGFQVLTFTIGEDGSLVRFNREWLRFWQGRIVGV